MHVLSSCVSGYCVYPWFPQKSKDHMELQTVVSHLSPRNQTQVLQKSSL